MIQLAKQILDLLKNNESKTDSEKEFLLENHLISSFNSGIYIRKISDNKVEVGHLYKEIEIEVDAKNIAIIKVKEQNIFDEI